MAYFLGIDGGGTKTTCVVGDESKVLGSASAGGSNIVRLGEDEARRNIHQAVREACAAAGIPPVQVTSACIGVAGVSATGVAEKVRGMIAEIVPGRVSIVGDMEIALEAAFGDGPGVLVIAGTGSIAVGRDKVGNTARVGGWGYAISDEGSGHWIGRELVRRALHYWGTDEATDLPLIIQRVWKVETPEEVVRIANASPPPNFAALFPMVLKFATEGDPEARSILEDAAIELARMAEEVIRRLWRSDATRVPVAMSGSIFVQAEIVCQTFFRILRSRDLAYVLRDVADPAMGALQRARKAAPND